MSAGKQKKIEVTITQKGLEVLTKNPKVIEHEIISPTI
jgi:hypothetical protein